MKKIAVYIFLIFFLQGWSNNLLAQEYHIGEDVIRLIIQNDSSYINYVWKNSNTLICINCKVEKFLYQEQLVKTFNTDECIDFLRRNKKEKYTAIRIDRIEVNLITTKIYYTLGYVKHSYYNKRMQLLAVSHYGKKQIELPHDLREKQ